MQMLGERSSSQACGLEHRGLQVSQEAPSTVTLGATGRLGTHTCSEYPKRCVLTIQRFTESEILTHRFTLRCWGRGQF